MTDPVWYKSVRHYEFLRYGPVGLIDGTYFSEEHTAFIFTQSSDPRRPQDHSTITHSHTRNILKSYYIKL
jgi:hypothetical protein